MPPDLAHSASPGWTVVLPVKRASRAKSRLAAIDGSGGELARAIALDTIDAVADCPAVGRIVVVTDDPGLDAWLPRGIHVIRDHRGAGTNPAILTAMLSLAPDRPRAALLADLPALRSADLAEALVAAGRMPRAVVADADGSGSTLVTAGPGVAWASAFGPGSLGRHVALGCQTLDVLPSSSLRRDVDTPEHLEEAAGAGLGSRTGLWWRTWVQTAPSRF